MKFEWQGREITLTIKDPSLPPPYDLLELADPSRKMINAYLPMSSIYLAHHRDSLLGVLVIYPIDKEMAEIKNIAIKASEQGKGLGSQLLKSAIQISRERGLQKLRIGTANSSLGQLYLYQKMGFDLVEIIPNFFKDNYATAIFENGLEARHMLVLEQTLT